MRCNSSQPLCALFNHPAPNISIISGYYTLNISVCHWSSKNKLNGPMAFGPSPINAAIPELGKCLRALGVSTGDIGWIQASEVNEDLFTKQVWREASDIFWTLTFFFHDRPASSCKNKSTCHQLLLWRTLDGRVLSINALTWPEGNLLTLGPRSIIFQFRTFVQLKQKVCWGLHLFQVSSINILYTNFCGFTFRKVACKRPETCRTCPRQCSVPGSSLSYTKTMRHQFKHNGELQ